MSGLDAREQPQTIPRTNDSPRINLVVTVRRQGTHKLACRTDAVGKE
jgi:hypothetical protein